MSGMFTVIPIIILVIAAAVLVIFIVAILRSARDTRTASDLSARGERTTGRVIATNSMTTGGANDTRVRTELVETIEFETRSGQRIRGNPMASDIDMLDRSGKDVTVLYDPRSPERFIAPKNGQRLAGGPGGLLAIGVIGIIVAVIIGVFAWTFIDGMSMMNPPGF